MIVLIHERAYSTRRSPFYHSNLPKKIGNILARLSFLTFGSLPDWFAFQLVYLPQYQKMHGGFTPFDGASIGGRIWQGMIWASRLARLYGEFHRFNAPCVGSESTYPFFHRRNILTLISRRVIWARFDLRIPTFTYG